MGIKLIIYYCPLYIDKINCKIRFTVFSYNIKLKLIFIGPILSSNLYAKLSITDYLVITFF